MVEADTQTIIASRAIHEIPLDALKDSKIVHVNLYSGLAEVTRRFRVRVNPGSNDLIVSGFTDYLRPDTVRVDSRGPITIHDVSVSRVELPPPQAQISAETISLTHKKSQNENALSRCRKSLAWLEKYLNSIDVKHTEITKIGEVTKEYRKATGEIQDEILSLEREKEEIDKELQEVTARLNEPPEDKKRRNRVKIVVVKDGTEEGDVEIFVKYSVNNASWHAAYDVRVNLQPSEKQKPVTIVYKAAIIQSTEEPWDDVQLSLETASPTHNLQLPNLHPWHLSVYKKPVETSSSSTRGGGGPGRLMRAQMFSFNATPARNAVESSSDEEMGFGLFDDGPAMAIPAAATISSQGNVNATYTIPGTVSIPSDGIPHKVTVVQLQLDAEFEWVVVPKKDTRVHIKAKVKNASEYTLFPGQASNFVDGSFISTSYQPLISPQETFPCSLGIDPSIRITYHPLSKEESKSGFVNKSNDRVFIQRLTIKNTKPVAIPRLRIFEQIPVSQDAQINVKMIAPALSLPPSLAPASSSAGTLKGGEAKRPSGVKVTNTVTAQWEGTDDLSVDVDAIGRNGRLNWVCQVQSQETVNLTLQYEVSAPSQVVVLGL